MIAPTSAIAQGRARGEACPTMVSTISSAPPESASNLANIAPNAIRMPTPAAVEPNPSAKDLSTFCRSSPATMPTVNAPKISARNGCSLTTVIKTTITAIPARKARISCQPDATAVSRVKVSAYGHGVAHGGVGMLREVAELTGLSAEVAAVLANTYRGHGSTSRVRFADLAPRSPAARTASPASGTTVR